MTTTGGSGAAGAGSVGCAAAGRTKSPAASAAAIVPGTIDGSSPNGRARDLGARRSGSRNGRSAGLCGAGAAQERAGPGAESRAAEARDRAIYDRLAAAGRNRAGSSGSAGHAQHLAEGEMKAAQPRLRRIVGRVAGGVPVLPGVRGRRARCAADIVRVQVPDGVRERALLRHDEQQDTDEPRKGALHLRAKSRITG